MQTRPPTTVLSGRYALEEELGRSATGMAWRADDRLLRRTVTIKLIHPSLADDPAFAGCLADETRRVASLSAPGLARLLDIGREDGVTFLVREHVEGMSARARLSHAGPLPHHEAARIAIAVLDALAPAHEAGVLHLHLDLDNVVLTPDAGVRVTDLGVGRAVTATRTPADAVRLLGAEGLAPEVRSGGPADARTDVFEAGALLFELLTGAPPGGRRSARETRTSVPRGLDRVVARALAPDPDERFGGVAAFASALRASLVEDHRGDASRRGWLGAWLGVPIAILVVAVAVIAVGLWVGQLEVGGPLGIRPAAESPSAAPAASQLLRPASARAFDPFGSLGENDSIAALAIDGDATTAWRSENYFDGRLNKPGVGLVFDLGSPRTVTGFRLTTAHPGFVFHVAVGDDPDALVDAVGGPFTADVQTQGTLEGSGRYVLLWITTVVQVDDGDRAEVAEFRVQVDGDA